MGCRGLGASHSLALALAGSLCFEATVGGVNSLLNDLRRVPLTLSAIRGAIVGSETGPCGDAAILCGGDRAVGVAVASHCGVQAVRASGGDGHGDAEGRELRASRSDAAAPD